MNSITGLPNMEYVAGGVILFELEHGKILYINHRALDIFECGNLDEFRNQFGACFRGAVRGAIHPEDYGKFCEELGIQLQECDESPRQFTYRIRVKKGDFKRIYHVGQVFRNTPYGNVFSVLVSEDEIALKDYLVRKNAFRLFMASGEATCTKSYGPGYKSFFFWNITKNSPVIRMDGFYYIPREFEGCYTYDNHLKFISTLLPENGGDIEKLSEYTREKILVEFMNGHAVSPLCLNYNLKNGWFSIKSTFEMMADPDSGDIILKMQNENNMNVEAYKELAEITIMNLYDEIVYIDGASDNVLTLLSIDGKPMYVQRTISDAIDNLCMLFQIKSCSVGQFMDVIEWRTASGEAYGKKLMTDDGKVKYVWAKSLYEDSPKYLVTVLDISNIER